MESKKLFWKIYKESKICNKDKAVRKHEELRNIVIDNWDDFNDKKDKFYNFYSSFKFGYTVTNKFGKKLYFKRCEA